jgi:hypothetical protein
MSFLLLLLGVKSSLHQIFSVWILGFLLICFLIFVDVLFWSFAQSSSQSVEVETDRFSPITKNHVLFVSLTIFLKNISPFSLKFFRIIPSGYVSMPGWCTLMNMSKIL